MASILFESWVGEVSLRVQGAAEPIVLAAIRRSTQQFCADTRVWKQTLGHQTVNPPAEGETDVQLTVPSPAPSEGEDPGPFVLPPMSRLIAIADVLLDGSSLNSETVRGRGRRGLLDDDRVFGYDEIEATLTIAGDAIPSSGILEVRAVLSPDDGATGFPSALARWKLGIIDRTLYELMLMPNRDWTNPLIANEHLKAYNLRVAEGTVAKSGEGTTTPVRSARIATF